MLSVLTISVIPDVPVTVRKLDTLDSLIKRLAIL